MYLCVKWTYVFQVREMLAYEIVDHSSSLTLIMQERVRISCISAQSYGGALCHNCFSSWKLSATDERVRNAFDFDFPATSLGRVD